MSLFFEGMSEEEVQDMLLSVEIDKRGEIDYKGNQLLIMKTLLCDGKVLSTLERWFKKHFSLSKAIFWNEPKYQILFVTELIKLMLSE